jgi:hypothetical protein
VISSRRIERLLAKSGPGRRRSDTLNVRLMKEIRIRSLRFHMNRSFTSNGRY